IKGYSDGSRSVEFSGQITTAGAAACPALTRAARFRVASAWFCVTSVSFSCCGRFLARGTSPWIAATSVVGARPVGSTGSSPPASTSPAVTAAASAAPQVVRGRPLRKPPRKPSAARAIMAPVSATRKLRNGAPPMATQRTSGATDWLIASLPQGQAARGAGGGGGGARPPPPADGDPADVRRDGLAHREPAPGEGVRPAVSDAFDGHPPARHRDPPAPQPQHQPRTDGERDGENRLGYREREPGVPGL